MQTAEVVGQQAVSGEIATAEMVHIPAHLIERAWPAIEHLVPSIIERSRGRVSVETLADDVTSGRLIVLAAWHGGDVIALVGLQISIAATGLKLGTIRFATGANSHLWLHLIGEVEDMARRLGCERLEMWARKGWARRLQDYEMTHILLEKAL